MNLLADLLVPSLVDTGHIDDLLGLTRHNSVRLHPLAHWHSESESARRVEVVGSY